MRCNGAEPRDTDALRTGVRSPETHKPGMLEGSLAKVNEVN